MDASLQVELGTPCCFIERLLQSGADPNGGGMLMTPLQVAAQRWDFEAIELLLQNEADPNATGVSGGKTCLGWRSEYGTWSPLRIYRLAKFESLYVFHCSCGARLPLHHETHCCLQCQKHYPNPENARYIELRHIQIKRKADIGKLLVSKGARDFMR